MGQPETITDLLRDAARNPVISLFNPKYGGHVGALLDPLFPQLVRDHFSKKNTIDSGRARQMELALKKSVEEFK